MSQIILPSEIPREITSLLNIFDKFSIPQVDLDLNGHEIVASGGNGCVYKFLHEGKTLSCKKSEVFTDTSFSLVDKDSVISQTAINEIIVAHHLSEINFPTLQKMYGYNHTQQDNKLYLLLVKKYYDFEMQAFLESREFTSKQLKEQQEILSNLIIHILLTVRHIFINKFQGKYSDISLRNILIHRTKKEFIQYGDLKVKLYGYKPVFSDFGSSQLVVNDMLIMRTDWKDESITLKNLIDYKEMPYDNAYDTYIFFKNLYEYSCSTRYFTARFKKITSTLVFNNYLLQEYMKLISAQVACFGSTKGKFYKPNCIPLDTYLNQPRVASFLKTHYFI